MSVLRPHSIPFRCSRTSSRLSAQTGCSVRISGMRTNVVENTASAWYRWSSGKRSAHACVRSRPTNFAVRACYISTRMTKGHVSPWVNNSTKNDMLNRVMRSCERGNEQASARIQLETVSRGNCDKCTLASSSRSFSLPSLSSIDPSASCCFKVLISCPFFPHAQATQQ